MTGALPFLLLTGIAAAQEPLLDEGPPDPLANVQEGWWWQVTGAQRSLYADPDLYVAFSDDPVSAQGDDGPRSLWTGTFVGWEEDWAPRIRFGVQGLVQDLRGHRTLGVEGSVGSGVRAGLLFHDDRSRAAVTAHAWYDVGSKEEVMLVGSDLRETSDDPPSDTWSGVARLTETLGRVDVMVPWTATLRAGPHGVARWYGHSGSADLDSFSRHLGGGLAGTWFVPQAGRSVRLSVDRTWTASRFAPYGEATLDDGEILDRLAWDEVRLRWVESVPIPAPEGHRLRLDLRLGAIDRNVPWQGDEFKAGGGWPDRWREGEPELTACFPGYPLESLSGETLAVLHAGWRVPVVRDLDVEWRGMRFGGIHTEAGATAGNLWSYRVTGESVHPFYQVPVAADGSELRREIPFVDEASANGNRMLYDVSLDLRVEGSFQGGLPWDSFATLAWGFNRIEGYDGSSRDFYDIAPSGDLRRLPRVILGVGSGW